MKISLQFDVPATKPQGRKRSVLIGHETGGLQELLRTNGRTEISVALPTIESQFLGRSACNIVTVCTELPWIVRGF